MKERLKKILNQLFCHHDYHIIRWHWTHGPENNNPREIQYAVKCSKCGKIGYRVAPRHSCLEECLICHKELENYIDPYFDLDKL